MTEFQIRNYNGHVYMKDELQKILNSNPLRCIANAKSVVLFSKDTPLEEVKRSLAIVIQDIELRLESEANNKTAKAVIPAPSDDGEKE